MNATATMEIAGNNAANPNALATSKLHLANSLRKTTSTGAKKISIADG